MEDEDEKIEYLNKLDEKYYYGYVNEFNIKHLNPINNCAYFSDVGRIFQKSR